jgi:hypothetical protein
LPGFFSADGGAVMSDGTGDFLRAPNLAESERLYFSMTESELQVNCLAAAKILAERMEETEIATRLGKQAEKIAFAQDRILRGVLTKLQLISKLSSRQNRAVQQEEIEKLTKMIQRRMPFDKVAGAYCIGGYAVLTTVDSHRVRQRRIHQWKEDTVGELIKPLPIDWLKWRAEREPRLSAKVIPLASAPLNRHQRRQQKAQRA